jgi:UDP-N-acetylmuramoyl-tripeptide--D-alanyl-D-alanine ligase
MGANHQGEIAYLTRLARPDVALITNAGAAHLEGFGSFQGVACAKGEIYEGLDDSGTAIINEDDAFAGYWRAICEPHRCLGFALNADTDITAQYELTSKGSHVRLNTPAGPCEAHLALLGEHNVRNALAATAASLAAGCTLQSVTRGLESIKPVARRLELKPGLAGSSIIDDTYNANPSSLSAALKVLHGYPGTHYLALGDMGELGDNSCQLHHDAGVEARDSGVSRLYTLGEWAACAADGFGEMAQRFSDQAGMVQAIKETLSEEVTLLVKGSRSMRMDEVVDALTAGGGGM